MSLQVHRNVKTDLSLENDSLYLQTGSLCWNDAKLEL